MSLPIERAALAEMHGARRRNCHFRRRRACDPSTNLKWSRCGWPVEADLADHAHALGLGLDAWNLMPVPVDRARRRQGPCRNRTATRSGGTRRRSSSLRPTSSCFLMTASISRSSTTFSAAADLALGALRPRLLQRRRPQQAADVVGAERRLGSGSHFDSSQSIFRRWGNGPPPSKPLARYGANGWRARVRLAWRRGGRPSI